MKKVLSLILVVVSVGFISCESSTTDDEKALYETIAADKSELGAPGETPQSPTNND
ncbi:hypothetical protein [Leptobacterium sp. I13]|uniref:hypothetical protein n=1 Tax=Leptobacterium meishanense TaxID=3128904 RepID=UPI0030ED9B9A